MLGKERSVFGEFLQVILISIAIILPVRYFLIQPFIVRGASMEPNFYEGEYLIIDELSYFLREPHRGEVVVFRFPHNPSTYYIKRIIGVPGDTVEVRNGEVSIKTKDGTTIPFNEGVYLPPAIRTSPDNAWHVLAGSYFVMGDNRYASYDSRQWGLLERKYIVGRVLLRALPFKRWEVFPSLSSAALP